MEKLIKINGTYGGKVGNLTVFTREGAVKAYRTFCEVCRETTMESTAVLMAAADDMHKLGFSWSEIEQIEIDYLESR